MAYRHKLMQKYVEIKSLNFNYLIRMVKFLQEFSPQKQIINLPDGTHLTIK